jgi:hypothetical protein
VGDNNAVFSGATSELATVTSSVEMKVKGGVKGEGGVRSRV